MVSFYFKFGKGLVIGITQNHTRNSDPWQTVKEYNTDLNHTDLKGIGYSSDSNVSGLFILLDTKVFVFFKVGKR